MLQWRHKAGFAACRALDVLKTSRAGTVDEGTIAHVKKVALVPFLEREKK